VETMEETWGAATQPGGTWSASLESAGSVWKWKGSVADIDFAACATSPEQRLLA
jgi:hypothetical protein